MDTSINSRFNTLLAVLDNAVDAIISIDEDGQLLTYNPAAEKLFQYTSADVMDLGLEALMTDEDSSDHQHYIDRYMSGGSPRIIGLGREVRCRRRDGTTFGAHLSISESLAGEKRVFTAIIRDLTERDRMRKAEAALLDNKLEHAIVLQYAPIGIVTMNEAGQVLSANSSAVRITGYSEATLRGRSAIRFIHTDDQLAVNDSFQRLIAGDIAYTSSSHRLRHQEGHYVPIRTFNAAVVHKAPPETVLISMFEDLSLQRAREEEIKVQRERLAHVTQLTQMGEMAAGLAHELNQPLSAISSYAGASRRLVQKLGSAGDELQLMCERIGQQATRAGKVIRKVRDLTRRHETTRRLCSINKLISDLIPLVEIDFQHTDIRLQLSLGPDVEVLADAVQIEQVLLNFLRNSIDAVRLVAPDRHRIELGTTKIGDQIKVSVSDQGTGFDKSIRDHIFEPFVSSKAEGMGMGLSISKSIVEAHDGVIGINDNPNGGSICWFTLPVVQKDETGQKNE